MKEREGRRGEREEEKELERELSYLVGERETETERVDWY